MQPLQEAILVNSSQQLSLSGKLYLSFPGGACPETPQTFANALPGAVFVTPGDAEPVQLQPLAFSAQVRLAGCCACIRGAAARLCVHLTAAPSVPSCADWNCRFSVCHLPRSGVQPQLGSVASATCKASQWSVQDNNQCASRKRQLIRADQSANCWQWVQWRGLICPDVQPDHQFFRLDVRLSKRAVLWLQGCTAWGTAPACSRLPMH